MGRIMASLVWVTPDAEQTLVDIARVSSDKPPGSPGDKLIRSLIRRGHWSPLEMVNACIEIIAPRDVTRQILRHWTLRPQEFSQRYAHVGLVAEPFIRECRMQHPTDRQMSMPADNPHIAAEWERAQKGVWRIAMATYQDAIDKGIAREVARAVLPEGMTPSRVYLNGNARAWIHFCQLRSGNGTQPETIHVARACSAILADVFPTIWKAALAGGGEDE